MIYEFDQFQQVLSIQNGIILSILSVLIAWYTYKDSRIDPIYSKYILMSLRLALLVIIVLIGMNPVFKKESVTQTKPKIAVLFDDSRSVSMEKPIYKGTKDYEAVIKTFQDIDKSTIDYMFYSFSSELKRTELDSIQITGLHTDINTAFKQLGEQNEGIHGIIIISDGIFNKGRDPYFSIASSLVPVSSILLGDTVQVRDNIILDVLYPETAFVNSEVKIIPNIASYGYPQKDIEISLFSENELIESKIIHIDDDKFISFPEFIVSFETEGVYDLSLSLTPFEDEWFLDNNSQNFSIEVKDEKINILHVAFEIHPDVGTVREIFNTLEDVELTKRTWIGTSYLEAGSLPDSDSLDALIIHGLPLDLLPSEIVMELMSLVDRTPYWFLDSPSSSHYISDKSIQRKMRDVKEIFIDIDFNNKNHPIVSGLGSQSRVYPVLYSTIEARPSTLSTSLLVATNNPDSLIHSVFEAKQTGNIRSIYMAFWGYHSWYRNVDTASSEFIKSLITQGLTWLTAQSTSNQLNVTIPKRIYNEDEYIYVNTQVINDSGEPVFNARVEMNIDVDGLNKVYRLEHKGGGNYSIDSITLPAGTYSYSIIATQTNDVKMEFNGLLRIEKSNLEFIESVRNENLLKGISSETNGFVLDFSNLDLLEAEINNLNLPQLVTETTFETQHLYKSPIWFIILLVLATIEWSYRKRKNIA